MQGRKAKKAPGIKTQSFFTESLKTQLSNNYDKLYIHNDRKNHRLSLGFRIQELRKVILYTRLDIVPVCHIGIKAFLNRVCGNFAHLIHQRLRLSDVYEAS